MRLDHVSAAFYVRVDLYARMMYLWVLDRVCVSKVGGIGYGLFLDFSPGRGGRA